jgi:hypothetical protein
MANATRGNTELFFIIRTMIADFIKKDESKIKPSTHPDITKTIIEKKFSISCQRC